MKKKRGKAAKKARAAAATQQRDEELSKAPHSFVFHRGNAGKHIKELVRDVRKVMEPYTASKLQVKKTNTLRDLTSVAGVLHVSHCIMFTKTDLAPYMRIMRLPRGPTLTFKIHQYCLSRDVVSSLKRPNVEQSAFQDHPLLVMNNLSGEQAELKLMSTMFQNMYPSINVNKVKLNRIRRCVLVNYNKETQLLDFRHYLIRVTPVGISKSIKKLIRPKLPNMGRFSGLDEYIEKGGNLSESEGEMDGPLGEVVLPQEVRGRGNIKSAQSAIRLKEVGPRLTLQLVKVEEGICDGVVLFHEFVHKSLEEQQSIAEMRERKRQLREKRKQQQLANVKRKEQMREEHKKKSLEGMKAKGQAPSKGKQSAEAGALQDASDDSDDDDVEHFRQEVGTNPDEDTFSTSMTQHKRKLQQSRGQGPPQKKFKGKNAALQKTSKKREFSQPQKSKTRRFQPAQKRPGAKNSKVSQKRNGSSKRVRFQDSGTSFRKGKGGKTKAAGGKARKFQSKQKKS